MNFNFKNASIATMLQKYGSFTGKEYGEFAANKEPGEKFMAEIAKKKGVKELGKGVYYEVLIEGKGKIPADTDSVMVIHEGTLIDGTVVDSNVDNKASTMVPNLLIPGLRAALTAMPVGSKWKVYIPQEQAYGDKEMGAVKPYSAIILTIQLEGIKK